MSEATANSPGAHGEQRHHVNVVDDYELRYWGERFDVSPELLRRAVDAVGTSASHVEEWLAAHR
ncbi:DUF3606 domain-containing protein [Roseateles chitosanitabidus]|jgi:hypothetical protein|uniref:DUF3606 domain-containing protein n=1 Tax=Roseateles chitosanitabidus TaxID=65048 RepID=UPI0008337F2D|nr:DUF3606 domain-containing protein [Roseateles chitosanitabidus]MBO9687852.1 DUF3606 domain-containing protein [Roseateles chitosanitabidus]